MIRERNEAEMNQLMIEIAAEHGCTPEQMGAEHLWYLMQEHISMEQQTYEACK